MIAPLKENIFPKYYASAQFQAFHNKGKHISEIRGWLDTTDSSSRFRVIQKLPQ